MGRRGTRRALTTGAAALVLAGSVFAPTSAQESVHASFDFEDGLQGWTVIDRAGPSSWVHTEHGFASSGAIEVSPYGDVSSSVIVSPTIDVPAGSVLVFDAKWWMDPADWVQVRDQAAGTDFAMIQPSPRLVQGRGRAPEWDQFRFELESSGSIQIGFDLVTDDYCSADPRREQGRWRAWLIHCGAGMAIDNVRVVTPEHAATLGAAWGDAPGTSPMEFPFTGESEAALAQFIADRSVDRRPEGRGDDEFADQQANPDYQQAWAAAGPLRHLDDWWSDPLLDWEAKRGRRLDTWLLNRYRTPIGARMFAPAEDGEYPLVVFLGGSGSANWAGNFPMLQRLAEEGHVVLSVAWQGEGARSEYVSAKLPAAEFCASPEASADRWWRQPQEAGFVETQTCAGTAAGPQLGDAEVMAASYEQAFGAPTTFTAIDAVDWALSDDNPWRHLVDAARVGTMGHSAGAIGAIIAAQVDDRIGAAIAIDGYGRLPDRVAPTTPVLSVVFDAYGANQDLATNPQSVALDLREADVDTGILHLRNTSHYDFSWEPEQSRASAIVVRNAGNQGHQRAPLVKPMLQHWSLAWFDLHLDGDLSATARLTAETFDDAADRTAQGTGTWEAANGNIPYTIGGVEVAPQLSSTTTSFFHLAGDDVVLAGEGLPSRGASHEEGTSAADAPVVGVPAFELAADAPTDDDPALPDTGGGLGLTAVAMALGWATRSRRER